MNSVKVVDVGDDVGDLVRVEERRARFGFVIGRGQGHAAGRQEEVHSRGADVKQGRPLGADGAHPVASRAMQVVERLAGRDADRVHSDRLRLSGGGQGPEQHGEHRHDRPDQSGRPDQSRAPASANRSLGPAHRPPLHCHFVDGSRKIMAYRPTHTTSTKCQ